MRKFKLYTMCLGLLCLSTAIQAASKVQVCHRPPDNPTNRQIILVAQSAVSSHTAHGDNVVAAETITSCSAHIDNDCDGLSGTGIDPDCPVIAECPCVSLWTNPPSTASGEWGTPFVSNSNGYPLPEDPPSLSSEGMNTISLCLANAGARLGYIFYDHTADGYLHKNGYLFTDGNCTVSTHIRLGEVPGVDIKSWTKDMFLNTAQINGCVAYLLSLDATCQ